MVTAVSLTQLIEDGDATAIHYEIDAALTGKLGGIGQPVVKAKVREMEKQFVTRLRAAFEEPAPAQAQ